MIIPINLDLALAPNYRFTVTDSETAARIFLAHIGLKETSDGVKEVLRSMMNGSFRFSSEMAQAIREYQGLLFPNLRILEAHNKIPNVLRYELAKLIAGQTVTPTFKANYLALGSGSTAPADSDIKLVTETKRWLFSNRTATNNTTFLDKFFTSSEVGGMTFLEAGVYVDGTWTIDTWYLLSRVLINVVISATETLTVNATFTINSTT